MELRKVVRIWALFEKIHEDTNAMCLGYSSQQITRYVLPDQLGFRTEGPRIFGDLLV
jgi:hypothetical protein